MRAKRIAIYRVPLSCSSNETIATLAFNRQQIVLLIGGRCGSKWRLEFRTRGMIVLKCISLGDELSRNSLVQLRLPNEWLFRYQTRKSTSWKYLLIDQNLCSHEQKLLSTIDIDHIGMTKDPKGKDTLFVTNRIRVEGDTMRTTNALMLKFYRM